MTYRGRDPDMIDHEVRIALGEALGERKLRLTDQRLLILYCLFVVMLIGLSLVVQRTTADRHAFERRVIANCEANQQNTRNFNAFIDKLLESYRTSPLLTPHQKAQRIAFFAAAKQPVPECPPTR